MIKKSAICFAVAGVATLGLVGCNSSSEDDSETTLSSSVLISSFSLSEDDDVLDDLDSVYFSIDLVKASIFNADSLPYGTDVSKLVPVITSSDGLSVAELHVPRPGQADTIYNYITNSTDSIDFSNGPVKLHVVSLSGEVSRDYTIRVNVHTVKTDSLAWGDVARRALPSKFSTVKSQRTAAQGDVLYCLTSNGAQYSVAMVNNPGEDNWAVADVTLPTGADINTFTGTNDALYILTDAGELYKSTDGAFSWTDCGVKMNYLYGGYGTSVIGAVEKSDGWHRVSYPAGLDEAVESDFPISGTSMPVIFSTPLALSNQMLIFGGRTAAGDLLSTTWGYDGSNWAKLTVTALPKALEDLAVVPYFTYKTADDSWAKGDYATLIALGGREADKTLNRTVYVSCDYGITWAAADSLMQTPDVMPSMANMQGFVYKSVLTTRSASSTWQSFATRRVPSWLIPYSAPASRVTQAVTEWECPYIYLFGGEDTAGNTFNTIWRGVINRYTFKPIV
jgi:hypothetical protein